MPTQKISATAARTDASLDLATAIAHLADHHPGLHGALADIYEQASRRDLFLETWAEDHTVPHAFGWPDDAWLDHVQVLSEGIDEDPRVPEAVVQTLLPPLERFVGLGVLVVLPMFLLALITQDVNLLYGWFVFSMAIALRRGCGSASVTPE